MATFLSDEQIAEQIIPVVRAIDSRLAAQLKTDIVDALRDARRAERERCAAYLDAKAAEMEQDGSVGLRVAARIYRDDAAAIRALSDA